MKKIMFSDKFCLTAAVLAETKTQTRRIINVMPKEPKIAYCLEDESGHVQLLDGYTVVAKSKFKVGEVVAIAQSYKELDKILVERGWERTDYKLDNYYRARQFGYVSDTDAGWNNKMFVRADLMPLRIRIENVRVERLQDISEVDCIREGVFDLEPYGIRPKYTVNNLGEVFLTEKEAYAALIDKISGKGTWKRNPYCFCYTFKLID